MTGRGRGWAGTHDASAPGEEPLLTSSAQPLAAVLLPTLHPEPGLDLRILMRSRTPEPQAQACLKAGERPAARARLPRLRPKPHASTWNPGPGEHRLDGVSRQDFVLQIQLAEKALPQSRTGPAPTFPWGPVSPSGQV